MAGSVAGVIQFEEMQILGDILNVSLESGDEEDSSLSCMDSQTIPETPPLAPDTMLPCQNEDASNASQGLQCGECGKWLKSKSSLNGHSRRHKKDFRFSCRTCEEKFFNQQMLKEHTVNVHGGKSGVCRCTVCGKVMHSFRSMREHVKLHQGKEYWCHDCQKVFTSASYLTRHMLSHTRPVLCSYCEKTFATRQQMQSHMITHNPSPRIYACGTCTYKSPWKASVARHTTIVHTLERPYICDKCGKAFKQRGYYQKHTSRNSCRAATKMWEEL